MIGRPGSTARTDHKTRVAVLVMKWYLFDIIRHSASEHADQRAAYRRDRPVQTPGAPPASYRVLISKLFRVSFSTTNAKVRASISAMSFCSSNFP